MLQKQLQREILQESYYEFFLHFWQETSDEELVDNFHIKYICDRLQEYGERAIRREPKLGDLLINVPPGTSKSTICTVLFQPWLWSKDPTLQVITSSYAMTLSREHAGKSRDVIKSERYQDLFGHIFQIRKDKDGEGFFKNDKGGFRLATSTGTNVTGFHGHIVMSDDPTNPKVSESKLKSEDVVKYINSTLNSRKVNKKNAPTIMVMQRTGEDDPSGDWLDKKAQGTKVVEHICLPATDDYEIHPPFLKEFYVDGKLDPVRLDQLVLDEEMGVLLEAGFAGQYGQSPRSVEGNKVKYAWFEEVEPWDLPAGIVWDAWLDAAYTKKTENDPTGIDIVGYHKPTNTLYHRYAESFHEEMPGLLAKLPEIANDYGLGRRSVMYVEPKASGKTVVQMMRANEELMFSVVEIKSPLVGEGKEARLQTYAPRIRAKNVVYVKGPHLKKLKDQICTFPKAKHDEHVDNGGYASEHYFGKPKRVGVRRRN
jgi:predicted phage terminase large subunit-like protein